MLLKIYSLTFQAACFSSLMTGILWTKSWTISLFERGRLNIKFWKLLGFRAYDDNSMTSESCEKKSKIDWKNNEENKPTYENQRALKKLYWKL